MAFFNPFGTGGRDIRPGIYIRIVNRATLLDNPQQIITGGEEKPEPPKPTNNAVLVTPDGVMYARGPVFYLMTGADGENILVFQENTGVDTAVSGDALVIRNPGG